MPEIKTEIVIDAPVQEVWSIFTDFENYPCWNPLIPEIHCRKSIGSIVKVKLYSSGLTLPIIAKVTDYTINKRFAWGGPDATLMNWIGNAEHYFELQDLKGSQCLFIHGEKFKGALPGIAWPLLSRLEKSYSEMNNAFKRTVESQQNTPS